MRIGQQARNLRPQRSFWPGAGRGANLDLISTALTRAGAVVVVTGGGAMGKTRLALEAMARVEAASIPCRTVAGNLHDDLNAIIDEIARLPAPRSTDTKARALLVVDQAEDAGARTLERLILIAGKTSIAVMLVGRADLVGTLVRSVPEQVCDLVTRYVALEPLDTDQTAEFVAHCLGDEANPVICGSDALRRIAAHSHGVPGTIDRLMTDAVRLARLSRSARLTATVIDMIADEEHPPAEGPVTASPAPPVPSFRRKERPVATAHPAAHHPVARRPASDQIAAHQAADGTQSMRTVLTSLQETPASLYGHDDDDDDRDFRDPDGSGWPKSSANLLQPPAHPPRRIPPWAGGIAFVVVATSAIALQHYLQTGAPILTPADGSRTVVSSLLGDTGMRPAAPPPVVRTSETAQLVTPAPVHTAPGGGGQVPAAGHFQGMQVAVVESRMLDAPADAVTTPPVVAETVAEPSPEPPTTQPSTIQTPTTQLPAEEPTAETMPELEMVPPAPPAPAESVLPEPELPAPAAENLPEPEEVPAPTAESPPEQAPADTATESAPSDAVEPSIPETPAVEISPPPEPVPSEPVVSEPTPPPTSEPEPTMAEPTPPPTSEPEPTVAEPTPSPSPESEPTMAEPTPSPTSEPEPTMAEPTPPPASEPEPTIAEPTPPPTPEPEPTMAEPTPPPDPEPEPTLAEPTPPPAPEPEPTIAEPTPPPVPEPEPTMAEPTPPPTPEPEPTLAEPTPLPAPEPEPTIAEPAPQPAPESPAPAPAVVTAAPPPPPPPAPAPATPKPSSIAESVLLERGDRLLALGDIASARLLYETAAAGGSARGALLAGRTLDPAYLRSLGTRGVAGDPARAADWYEKAAKLGDDSATAHLEALGRR
ncbi:MAG TPA: hypothetical protein VEX87_02810 [Skermanella sp.]|nr:hypothetical protein [Skermanella sp.]